MKSSIRNKIKESNFALPEQRKYPIHDIKHARLALAFVSMHGSPSEKVIVRSKVHKKYPEINKEANLFTDYKNPEVKSPRTLLSDKERMRFKIGSLDTFSGNNASFTENRFTK